MEDTGSMKIRTPESRNSKILFPSDNICFMYYRGFSELTSQDNWGI